MLKEKGCWKKRNGMLKIECDICKRDGRREGVLVEGGTRKREGAKKNRGVPFPLGQERNREAAQKDQGQVEKTDRVLKKRKGVLKT